MSSPLRGVVTLERTADDRAAAPASGVLLGSGPDGPRTLRLFRQPGTRIVVFTALTTPQLLVARAGRLGVGVRVRTTRPDVWRAALRLADDAVVAPPGPEPAPSGRLTAPVLIVDDRPGENAPPGDVGGWQCRLDVRTGPSPADVGQYLGVDLVLVERLSPPVAEALGATFGLPRGASSTLTSLPGDGVALVRPGRIEVVSVAPAPDERGFVVAVSAPVRPPSAPAGRAPGTGWPSAPARPLSRPGPSVPPGPGPVPGSVRPPVPAPPAPGAGPSLPPPPARPRPGGTPPPTLPPPPPRPGRGRQSA